MALMVAGLGACAPMPGAPSTEDIENGMNSPVTAAPSLGGLVVDAQSGRGVEGAIVAVQGRTSSSSISGSFGFDANLTAGVYPVTVSHEGYGTVVQDVEIKPYQWQTFRLNRR
jgi:hypothetical protein